MVREFKNTTPANLHYLFMWRTCDIAKQSTGELALYRRRRRVHAQSDQPTVSAYNLTGNNMPPSATFYLAWELYGH